MTQEVLARRTERFDIWIGKQNHADPPFVAEVFIKIERGVKHLVHRYDSADVKRAMTDARRHGHTSRRPYALAQACDGSIASPVMALFAHLCEARGLDPVALYALAYPDEPAPVFEEVTALAVWQGVAYPRTWDEGAIDGLLVSLTAINTHSLVSALKEALIHCQSGEGRDL